MKNTVQKIAEHADKVLCLKFAELSPSYYYQSLPFCVVDAGFSIGTRYRQVENLVTHLSRVAGWKTFRPRGTDFPAREDQNTISDLLKLFEKRNAPEEWLFNNRCYANPSSTSNPVRKAELVKRFAAVLKEAKIETFQDLKSCRDKEALSERLCQLPALSSGIVVRYFFMLAGDEGQVKPDRWILSFIKDCTGESPGADEAAELIQGACSILVKKYPNLTPRLLDHEIWKYQRDKRGKKPRCHCRKDC